MCVQLADCELFLERFEGDVLKPNHQNITLKKKRFIEKN
jgi:hypothetical protein